MTLEEIKEREQSENEGFLRWIKSQSFQLQSHAERTSDLYLYMLAKNQEIGDLQSDVERLCKDAERYRKVRRLNPREFQEIWHENVRTGKHFDSIIDEIAEIR